MKGFFCKLGLLHDRNTDSGYVSGNGIWYTALGHELGCATYTYLIDDTIEDLVFFRYIPEFRIRTHRYKDSYVLDSHDNILAHLYFGSLTADDLDKTGWYINGYHKDDHTWKHCLSTAWKYRKELLADRNFWHDQELREIGKAANLLPQWVRYYAKPRAKYYVPFILHIMISYIKPNFKTISLKGEKWYKRYFFGYKSPHRDRQTNNVSAKIQCYFMLRTTGSKWLIKLFDIKELCDIYFDEAEHPIRRLLNE